MSMIGTRLFVCALSVASFLGCGGKPEIIGQDSDKPNDPGVKEEIEFAIKAWVQRDGETEPVLYHFGPADAAAVSKSADSSSPSDALGGGSRALAIVDQEGSTVSSQSEDARVHLDGATLLSFAVGSCKRANVEEPENSFVGTPWGMFSSGNTRTGDFKVDSGNGPNTPASGDVTNYYVFSTFPTHPLLSSCDAVLYYQELLLCGADRLAQLAESPGTTVWTTVDGVGSGFGTSAASNVRVTIPPQDSKDRFIARDMALNALGYVARLDTLKVPAVYVNGTPRTIVRTCTEQFADVAMAPSLQWLSGIFAPNNPTTTAGRKSEADQRLKRLANVLAGSARLTKSLIEESVREDLSGAEQARAAAADSRLALRRSWGVAPSQAPYNTIRHAIRTLFGRLEIGTEWNFGTNSSSFLWEPHLVNRDDPGCHPVTGAPRAAGFNRAADLLPNLGFGIASRWKDLAPATPGESLAMSVVESAGVVVPLVAGASGAQTPAALRAAVKEQVIREASVTAGLWNEQSGAFAASEPATFRASARGRSIGATVDGWSDAEIRFALDRTYNLFLLLTERDTVTGANASAVRTDAGDAATKVGLRRAASAFESAELSTVGGIVIRGGLPREALGADPLVRMSIAQRSSQCGIAPIGATAAERLTQALSSDATDVTSFQNGFLLGANLARRLQFISATTATETSLSDLHSFVASAQAEIKQWTAGTILRRRETAVNREYFYLVNLVPADLGARDLNDLKARLISVSAGQAAYAECLAGLRTTCPDMTGIPQDAPSTGTNFTTILKFPRSRGHADYATRC